MNKQTLSDYSTVTISKTLMDEILQALKMVHEYGSVEIYVQKNTVTQITVRNIRKTNGNEHTPRKGSSPKSN